MPISFIIIISSNIKDDCMKVWEWKKESDYKLEFMTYADFKTGRWEAEIVVK